MDHYSFYDSARELGRVDRLVNTPGLGGTRVAARRLRSYLQSLHHVLVGQKGGESIDPSTHQQLHRLMSKAVSLRTAEEIKNLVRDIRHFELTLSSLRSARDFESRLQELEEHVKTVGDVSAETEAIPDKEVVTLESLRGKRLLFAIMPFSSDFEDVWIGGIKRAAAGTGLTAVAGGPAFAFAGARSFASEGSDPPAFHSAELPRHSK